jgi:Tol biopolymer transport system component
VFGVRLSSDGNALAVPLGDPSGDIWIFNLANGTRRRLTFGAPIVNTPVWSTDASRVAFSSDRLGGAFVSMFFKAASGAGTEELLMESPLTQTPTDWSADGRFLAYNEYDPRGGVNGTSGCST